MSDAPIDPGALNRRLVLEAPVESADGAGGVTRSYSAVATLWAAVEPVAARGLLLEGNDFADALDRVDGERSQLAGRLARGESALVPAGVGAYRVEADEEPVLLIKTELPPYAD